MSSKRATGQPVISLSEYRHLIEYRHFIAQFAKQALVPLVHCGGNSRFMVVQPDDAVQT